MQQNYLKTHLKSVHEKVNYPCDQGDYKSTTLGSLKSHIEAVHEKFKYPCNLCQYKASTQGHLKKHVESVTYYCTLCDKQFTKQI